LGDLLSGQERRGAGTLAYGNDFAGGIDDLLEVCRVLERVQKITACLAVLSEIYQCDASIVNGKLSRVVLTGVGVLEAFLRKKPTWDKLADDVPWKLPVASLQDWWENIEQFVIPKLKVTFLKSYLCSVVVVAHEHVDALPRYGHYVNDSVFNRVLAKRYLLADKVKRELQVAHVSTKISVSESELIYDAWKLSPGLASDPLFKDEFLALTGMQADIQKVTCIAATVACITSQPGDSQVRDAVNLVARNFALPKSVDTPLKAIAPPDLVAAKKKQLADDSRECERPAGALAIVVPAPSPVPATPSAAAPRFPRQIPLQAK
jgi:hypothetical protein